MKKPLLSIFLFLCICLHAAASAFQTDRAIVFIHIGKELPSHVETAITQARLFNESCDIILIANQKALDIFPVEHLDPKLILVSCESLVKTKEHEKFLLDRPYTSYSEGFWNVTSERFLYIYDLFCQHEIENVFHLEYDNMLYADIDELLPVLQQHYKGIAATFDNDQRCVPGIIFIPNKTVMGLLAIFFAQQASKNFNDMQCIALFKEHYSEEIDYLPIITEAYRENHALISPAGHHVTDEARFANHIEAFQSIFDAAAIGQYLGGTDATRHGPSTPGPGFINESCIFNPSHLAYEWIVDLKGRKVPFAVYNNTKYRINNLHIHSKKLSLFSSR